MQGSGEMAVFGNDSVMQGGSVLNSKATEFKCSGNANSAKGYGAVPLRKKHRNSTEKCLGKPITPNLS